MSGEFVAGNELLGALESGYAFTVWTGYNSISNGEYDYLLFRNPSGSNSRVKLTHISFGVDSSTARSVLKIYKNPTITTNGTALTVLNTNFSASTSPEVNAYKSPTISARGTEFPGAINPADSASRGLNRFYLLEPADDLLVTLNNSVNNVSSYIDIYWIEESL